jgi:NADH-ubiquinone oxidoreductase chain 2
MLLTSIIIWHPHTHLIPSILTLSLILKLGAAPCHFWFPQVMSSVSWINCLLLATWQKFAPLFILAYLLKPVSQQLIYFIAVANALTGGLIGLNQSNLRTLMAYSSITHIAWILSPLCINCPCLTSIYFLLYCFLTIPIFTTFALNHQSTPNQLINLHPLVLISTSILLLSLAGVPPLTGFFPKWILIQWLTWKYYAALLIFILLGSFINLYFYLTLIFNILITPITNSIKLKSLDYIQPFIISSSLLGLLVIITPYALTIFYKS